MASALNSGSWIGKSESCLLIAEFLEAREFIPISPKCLPPVCVPVCGPAVPFIYSTKRRFLLLTFLFLHPLSLKLRPSEASCKLTG